MSDTATKNLSGFGEKTDSNGNEFLAFTLGKEEYGIDILKVQETKKRRKRKFILTCYS